MEWLTKYFYLECISLFYFLPATFSPAFSCIWSFVKWAGKSGKIFSKVWPNKGRENQIFEDHRSFVSFQGKLGLNKDILEEIEIFLIQLIVNYYPILPTTYTYI